MAKNRKRRKLNKDALNRILKALAIVIVVLLLFSIAAFRLGHITYSGIGENIGDMISKSAGGDGYPYTVNSSDIKQIAMSSSNLNVLYDTGLKVLGSSAKVISDLQHNYATPMLFSFGSRSLIIDLGSDKFRVQTPSKLSYEQEFEHKLLTGDIAKNGSVAIASKSDKGTSMLTVFDGKRNDVFNWICAKEQIVCVDISDNGRYIVAGVIGAKDGDVYSDVYLFDINYKDPIASASFDGTSVVGVELLSGKNFFVVGNNIASFVNGKGERNDVDVSLNSVSRFSVSENNYTALLLSKFGSSYLKILKVYNSSGKEISSVEIDGAVKCISNSGRQIAVLSDDKLLTYNLRGKLIGQKEIGSDAISCCIGGSDIYVLFSNSINKYSATGNKTTSQKTDTSDENEEEVITQN